MRSILQGDQEATLPSSTGLGTKQLQDLDGAVVAQRERERESRKGLEGSGTHTEGCQGGRHLRL